MSPSVGTARRAALGESTSSNRGTGSPRRSWSGPSGQSPLFAVTNAPSATSVTTARRSQRSRRPVRAHHQTWTMAPRNATVIAPWPARKARAAGDKRPSAMLARMASAAYFVQTRGHRFLLLGGPAVKVSGRSGEVGVGVVAHFSFGAWGRRLFVGAVSASQFHAGPSGGQKPAGACRDRCDAAGAAGLEGLVA